MKLTRSFLIGLVAFMMIGTIACTRVGPGEVGIVVNNAGDDKGVLDAGVKTGWQFYMPGKTQIIKYPTNFKSYTYTRETNENKPINEEMNFTTKDGQKGTADIGFTLQVVGPNAPKFFVKYKIPGDMLDDYIHGAFRNILRSALGDEALKFTTDDIYFGSRRAELETAVKDHVNKIINSEGANIDQLGFVNPPRFSPDYIKSIEDKLKALQDAQKVDAERQIAESEAKKRVVEAKGIADAKIEDARGDAESQRIRNASITPAILEMKRLEIQDKIASQWDGSLPIYMMGGGSNTSPTGILMQMPQLSHTKK